MPVEKNQNFTQWDTKDSKKYAEIRYGPDRACFCEEHL